MSFKKIQQQTYEANMKLPELGLVLFTFGNVSVVDRDQSVFGIKPSGIPYEALKPEDIVIIDFEAQVVYGKMRPSSDTKTHALLYKNWNSIGSIVHTHSTYATAWAQSLRAIPIYGTTHADHLTVDVPCAPPMDDEMIKGNYEHETGFQIINYFKEKGLTPEETEMILVGNHAPFAWGKSAEKAVYNAAVLELLAKMAFITEQVNPDVKRMKSSLINKHYERKHGKNSYYGQAL